MVFLINWYQKSKAFKTQRSGYFTIIPRVRVGYEMLDTRLFGLIIPSPPSASGIFVWLNKRSADHDVVGMTARIDATL